jgi:hypothetical protein
MAFEHTDLVVATAHALAAASRSPVALPRVAAIARVIVPRVVPIEHLTPSVAETEDRHRH